MTRIVGIVGSLRKHSYNRGLLLAAQGLMPAGATLDVLGIDGVPLYDGDVEAASGIPAPVTALKDTVAMADGLIIASPEYNNSMPGALKNAIDWMSRPPDDSARVFADRAVAVIGASPGGFGTILAQDAWLSVLRTLNTRPWFGGRLLVSKAGSVFDAEGTLTDEPTRERLREFLAGFVAFAQR